MTDSFFSTFLNRIDNIIIMNQKQIGIIVLIVGIILSIFVTVIKVRDDNALKLQIMEAGSCFLDDGTCLHDDRDYTLYVFGWILSAALIILGIYLIFFDKTQEILSKNQVSISKALERAKTEDAEKKEFNAFLSGFPEEEQRVIKAIFDQDGIKQSTLRFRANVTKSTLSLILKDFEKRNIVSRKKSGKTNEVYLIKKF